MTALVLTDSVKDVNDNVQAVDFFKPDYRNNARPLKYHLR